MIDLIAYPFIENIIANISFGLEIIAVLIILFVIITALFTYAKHLLHHDPTQECINAFKRSVGKGIQIALEMLIAADLINTVVLSATLENVAVLAILVLIRTFLSWTLIFETEGRWPWNKIEKKKKKKKKKKKIKDKDN